MRRYTLRPTWRDQPDDFVFRVDGRDAGRCYLRQFANNELLWSWTIYIGLDITGTLPGVPIAGATETLDQAKAEFRASYERLAAQVGRPI
jgi:hypothetical protein